jgi:Hypothetical glycosyl hydrolase family 15
MRSWILIAVFLAFAVSCTASPRPAIPSPTAFRFPSTWTPEPTGTPEPPSPTATLVIQTPPGVSSAGNGNIHHFPAPSYGEIGAWVDTTHLSADSMRLLAPLVQLATGPQAGAARQLNRRVIDLARFDAAGRAESVLPFARALESVYDGALLEHVASGEAGSQSGTSGQLLASVRIAIGPRLLIADTYAWTDGTAFAEHRSDIDGLLADVEGACMCQFLRASASPLSNFKTEAEWKKDVDGLAALSSHSNLIVLVATRFDQVTDEEVDQLQSWFDYALASFLIGENGSYAYFSFQGPHADDFMASAELSTGLGSPVGAYFPSFGVYARHFQHGLVGVNAGDTLREMPLTRTYVTPLGEQLTRVRLEPHTGVILLTGE